MKARGTRTCFWLDINNRTTSAIAIIQFTPDNCDRRISILQAVIKLKIFSGRSTRFGGSKRSSLPLSPSPDQLAKVRDPSRLPSYEFVPRICFRLSLTCPFPPLHTYAYHERQATDTKTISPRVHQDYHHKFARVDISNSVPQMNYDITKGGYYLLSMAKQLADTQLTES